MRGPGEKQIETDRQIVKDQIQLLKKELEKIDRQSQTQRKSRGELIRTSLVGYTNAGKSSLMRAMTGSEVLVADKLFATLDTTIRPLYPDTRPKVLMTDTVGFIKKLPHDLVASFKSTLDEAAGASLVLFVVDASDPSFRSQLEVTQKVLAEVGATDIPSFLVLNKRDRLDPTALASLKAEYPQAFFLSTRDQEDLAALREALTEKTALVYVETPGNPLWTISDIAAIADIAHRAGALLAVDSTVATPMATQPLRLGADLGQGYFVGRPLRADAVAGWMAQWEAGAPA